LLHLLLPLPLPLTVPMPTPLAIFIVKFIVRFIVKLTRLFPVAVVTQCGGCIVTVQVSSVTGNFTVKFIVTFKV
jgi:hypothetical protein